MHIALILDDERLLHEQVMISRLCVGLIDEGCTLTRIIPLQQGDDSETAANAPVGLSARISVPLKVLPWMRRARVEQIVQSIQRSEPDVVYGYGVGTWQLALDLGKHMNRPVAINVWSADLMREVPTGRTAASIGAYVTPSQALARALREMVDPNLVSYVPQGVAISADPAPVFEDSSKTITLAVVGSGRDLISYKALLSGLSRIVRDEGNLHAFIELRGPQQHEIWRHAHRLELLSNMSATTDAAQFRTLLTQCGMLLLPERFGEVRSLLLEAMAMGMPVVAAEDPFQDTLVADATALIVADADPEQWASQLRRLLSDRVFAVQLGLAGRKYIQTHHRSSDQVSALVETLSRVVHGEAINFRAPKP